MEERGIQLARIEAEIVGKLERLDDIQSEVDLIVQKKAELVEPYKNQIKTLEGIINNLIEKLPNEAKLNLITQDGR